MPASLRPLLLLLLLLVIGCVPVPPSPDPGPGPEPTPTPIESTIGWIVVIEEPNSRTADTALIMADPWWQSLSARNIRARTYHSTSEEAIGRGYVSAVSGVSRPAVLLLDASGRKIKAFSLPKTIDALKQQVTPGALSGLDGDDPPDPTHLAGLPRVKITDPEQVYDGDTLRRVDIKLPWGVTLSNQSIRAADYDAHEISRIRRTVTVTDEEIALGKQARDYLRGLLSGCEIVIVPGNAPRDNYGRVLARWYLIDSDGGLIPLQKLMTENHHTR